MVTIRLLLALATVNKFRIFGFDIKTAFLYGHLEEEIFMQQPTGFEINSQVCKLNRSIYGLKESPRMWNQRFTDCLKDFGLLQLATDPCVFRSENSDLIVCIYC